MNAAGAKILTTKNSAVFYTVIAAFLLLSFFTILYKPITAAFFENDMYSFAAPSEFQVIANNPFSKALFMHLFDPYQINMYDPVSSICFFVIFTLFGPQAKYLIFFLSALHILISLLVFLIVRKSGLGFRISFISSMIYFASFAHSQSYLWPASVHHLSSVFFIALVYYLYLETNRRIDSGKPYAFCLYLAFLIAFISSFAATIIFVIPAGIMAHIVFASKGHDDRIRRYNIWLPFFMIYLGYPLIKLACLGDYYLLYTLPVRLPLFAGPAGAAALYPVLFLFCTACLFLFNVVLRVQKYKVVRYIQWCAAGLIMACAFLHLLSRELHKDAIPWDYQISRISPYNFITPFAASLKFFIKPIASVLTINSERPYHFIPFDAPFYIIIAGLILLGVFLRRAFTRHRPLILFAVMYIITLRSLWGYAECPSRRMIYSYFLFCTAFAFSASFLYDFLADKIRAKKIVKDAVLIITIALFCIFNILAIRLEMFRWRLANTFLIYDYIKTAFDIKKDLAKTGQNVPAEDIYIDNVPVLMKIPTVLCASDQSRNYNLRFAMARVFNDRSMLRVNINEPRGRNERAKAYYADHGKVCDALGVNIDPFFFMTDSAFDQFRRNDYEDSLRLLKKAAEIRPFLLNYILGKYGLEDSKWITGQMPIRPWAEGIRSLHEFDDPGNDKDRYVSGLINAELSRYLQCLFLISYLEHRNGSMEESKYWFSRMAYIEESYDALLLRLNEAPGIRIDDTMTSFLNRYGNDFFHGALYKNRGRRFRRFLFRLLLNNDIIA